MKDQDPQKNKQGFDGEKQTYEPPKATSVRVQLEERVLGCNFSTIKNCGLTE
jgi:hypothetical protein